MQWYLAVLKNYVGFSGRARRKEYWMFTLINAIVGAIINVIQLILGLEFPFLSLIYLAATGSDSNLLIVFYVQIMPDDLVMQLHRF